MRRTTRAAATGAAVAALLLTGAAVAHATIGKAAGRDSTASGTTSGTAGAAAAARPCGAGDVSFYFGGFSQGLSHRSFDLTLLAHDGITCTLKDTPLVTVDGPPGQKQPVPVSVNGRGGVLILRPDSPLHTRVIYNAPDAPEDTLHVSTLTLRMPDHTGVSTYFAVPGGEDVYKDGVSLTSWTTGIGLGQGEEAF